MSETNQPVIEPEMLTITVVARKLALSERKIRYAIADGAIRVWRGGDAVRVPRNEFERICREGLPARSTSKLPEVAHA